MRAEYSNLALKVSEVLSIVSKKPIKLKNRKAYSVIIHGQAKNPKVGILPSGDRSEEPLVASPNDTGLQIESNSKNDIKMTQSVAELEGRCKGYHPFPPPSPTAL